MPRLNAILVQSDIPAAFALATALRKHCRSVIVSASLEGGRAAVPQHRADIVIADLELMRLSEIKRLHNESGDLSIVCTHRIPDEEMWAEALQAGAVDCCYSSDVRAIMDAALHHQSVAPLKAA